MLLQVVFAFDMGFHPSVPAILRLQMFLAIQNALCFLHQNHFQRVETILYMFYRKEYYHFYKHSMNIKVIDSFS